MDCPWRFDGLSGHATFNPARLLGKVKEHTMSAGDAMKHYIGPGNPCAQFDAKARYQARAFQPGTLRDGVGTVTLNRPERKNPLTFDLCRSCATCSTACALPRRREGGRGGAGGNLLGRRRARHHWPADQNDVPELLEFTRMTGDLVKADAQLPAAGDHRRH